MCSSSEPQPTQQVVSSTEVPAYARPYVERMLGKTEALSQTPYQAYGGERIAGFTPMQQQAFQSVGKLQPAQQLGTATQMSGIAGLQGLGAGQQYAQQATDPRAMQAYMSPYAQLALEPQMREAGRRSAIEGQQMMGQAARAGAFGGSRFGLMEAERQRNLGQLQSDIYGRGMQTAFEQARQAQQFGSELGLRGAGVGLQAAGALGQLGQQQFSQQAAAADAQARAGAQMTARDQAALDQSYQDFLNQRGYQQQQLSFMSDILRGGPLSQTSYQMYQAPPSMLSQAAGLGLAGYGLFGGSNPMIKIAEGGSVDDHMEKAPAGLAELAVQNVMRKTA